LKKPCCTEEEINSGKGMWGLRKEIFKNGARQKKEYGKLWKGGERGGKKCWLTRRRRQEDCRLRRAAGEEDGLLCEEIIDHSGELAGGGERGKLGMEGLNGTKERILLRKARRRDARLVFIQRGKVKICLERG